MATKAVKKKPAKASSSDSTSNTTAPFMTGSAVIPFTPISAETLRQFTPSTPSFETPFGSMESIMNNFKDQYEKFSSEATTTARQTAESYTKYTTSLAKGAEQIFKTLAELTQESAQRQSESLKALMACRTINEFAEAQNKLVQQNFDEAMSTATKISEMTIKVCNEAIEPLNGQVTKAMKKMSEKVAA